MKLIIMSEKKCPFINEKCIKENCMGWNIDKCTIFTVFKEGFPLRSFGKEEEEEIPEFLKRPYEDIAEELVDFVLKQKPKSKDLYELENYKFWKKNKVDGFSDEIEEIKEQVVELAKKKFAMKILPFKELDVEGITQSFIKLADETDSDILNEYRFSDFGILIDELPRKLAKKIMKALEIANEKLHQNYVLEAEKQEKELKAEARKHISDLIEWCKSKNMTKVSKNSLKVFLSEKGLKFPPVIRDIMYMEANEKYS